MAKFVDTALSRYVRAVVEGQIRAFQHAHPNGEEHPGHLVTGIGKRITNELCSAQGVRAIELALKGAGSGSGSCVAGRNEGDGPGCLSLAEGEHRGPDGCGSGSTPPSPAIEAGGDDHHSPPAALDFEAMRERVRRMEIGDIRKELSATSPLNRAREAMIDQMARIDNGMAAGVIRVPAELRRREFLAVIDIVEAFQGDEVI